MMVYPQKKKTDDYDLKLKQINQLLKQYDTLSPFSDNPNQFELIDSLRQQITGTLIQALNDKQTPQTDLDKRINNDALYITHSADRKIWFFSLDEKTGGTYRPFTTIVYYILNQKMAKAELFALNDLASYAHCVFDTVYLLDVSTQTYLALGGMNTCATCILKEALLLRIDSTQLQHELLFEFDGRYSQLKRLDFLGEAKELLYEYEVAEESDPLYANPSDAHANRWLQIIKGKFGYIDGDFVELEKCERREQRK